MAPKVPLLYAGAIFQTCVSYAFQSTDRMLSLQGGWSVVWPDPEATGVALTSLGWSSAHLDTDPDFQGSAKCQEPPCGQASILNVLDWIVGTRRPSGTFMNLPTVGSARLLMTGIRFSHPPILGSELLRSFRDQLEHASRAMPNRRGKCARKSRRTWHPRMRPNSIWHLNHGHCLVLDAHGRGSARASDRMASVVADKRD
jgi:hypothetical protein